MKSDEVKQTIIRLYYDEHKRPSEIALIIGKTPQYVSKIATKDKRYKAEKQYRKRKSLEKKKAYNREYNKTHVATIDRDNKILSTKTEMSDIDFVKWNRSIFGYAKNSSHLVLKKGIKVTADVPRIVKNIVHASSIRSSNVYSC